MRPRPLSYAVVTPARNEAANLRRLAESMVAQRHPPVAWAVVDDGSDDDTTDVVAQLARSHGWIRLLSAERREGALSDGRRHGRDLLAFKRGVRSLPTADVVVKVDADTSFNERFFEELMTRFAEQPDLGIAGGACFELERGRWVRRKVVPTHPRGASRAYRRECLGTVMDLEPCMGWDGIDEVRASVLGYRTSCFDDLHFRHHRPVGAREADRLRNGTAQGRAAWYMGYRPSYLLLRVAYRVPSEPSAIGMLFGYAGAAMKRERRHPDRVVVDRLRAGQRLRVVARRGALP
jgi:glycosyltransferase involved in cell wall biosynthesis